MNGGIRFQLSLMMFLQFFVWGSWAVTMGTYLNNIEFTGQEIGWAYSTTGWAAVFSPFLVGAIADRYVRAEVMMGILHLIGAVLMWIAASITEPVMFIAVLVLYALCYMPTLGLVNAISFNQMKDPGEEFGAVRMFGTLGWIIAGLVITFGLDAALADIEVEATAMPLQMAAIASLALGLYSFTLPRTPPKLAGHKLDFKEVVRIATGADALRLMRSFSFSVFVIGSLLVCIPLAFYYSWANPFFNSTGMEQVAGKMTMGQMSEAVFLLIMPFFFRRLGVKYMLIVGMLAWVARYVLFAYGNADNLVWMFYAGILLHGICYDFFFVTGQIYVDRKAPKEIQASAQGFIAMVTYGVGMVIGSIVAGEIVEGYTVREAGEIVSRDWQTIWLLPAGMAFVVTVVFFVLFREPKEPMPIDVEEAASEPVEGMM